jgi:type II secretion system protein C
MFQDLEALKPGFEDWLEKFNRETMFHGYPLMGRIPFEAFRAAAEPKVAEERPEPETEPISFHLPVVAPALSPPAPRADEDSDWEPGRRIWAFRAVNAALICLIIYFGWMAAAMLLENRQLEGALIATATPPSTSSPILDEAHDKAPALDEYHVVWERNLFGGSRAAEAPMKPEKVDVDKIAVAGKDVGLKLIGTVVANDPKLNYAAIDVAATREQAVFRENDRVGKTVIKAIFRNSVVIEMEGGQRRRLTIDEEPVKNPEAQQAGLGFPPESAAVSLNPDEIQGRSTFQVPRSEVPSTSEDIQAFIKKFNLTSENDQKKFGGFSVGRLRSSYLLYQLGMRTGDVIKGLDDYEFSTPQDLEYLFQRLSQGGNFTVRVERRGQPQKLSVLIE